MLSVYRHRAGSLRPDEVQDALVFADAVFVLALDQRGGVSADLREVIDAAFIARRAEVHQAAGLIAAQQNISVTDALARLRAFAYRKGDPLHEIAVEVMAGRLRLMGDRDDGDGSGVGDRTVRPPIGPETSVAEEPTDPQEAGSQHAETKQEDER